MKKQLADEYQLKAIQAGLGPVMVMAGPGSGKTYILTQRINYLINYLNISPDKILVITFTKKASEEMKRRFKELNPSLYSYITFGTFHSVFFRLLTCFSHTKLKIMSDNDKNQLLKSIIPKYSFFKVRSPSEILSLISKHKSGQRVTLPENGYKQFISLLHEYDCYKASLNLIDYDDILLQFQDLITKDNFIRSMISKRFDYILIDEFQDINRIQWDIIQKLLNSDKNLFTVGDDDQSIYGFRGSDSNIMNDYIKCYKPDVYELVYNYRSAKDIIDKSLEVISQNQHRIKQITSKSGTNVDGKFQIMRFDNDDLQGQFIKNTVKKEEGSVCILLRTNNDVIRYKELLKNDKTMNNSVINIKIKEDILSFLGFCITKKRYYLLNIIRNPETFIPSNIFMEETIDLRDYVKKYEKSNLFIPLRKLSENIEMLKKLKPYSFVKYLYSITGYKNFLIDNFGKECSEIESCMNSLLEKSKSFDSLSNFYLYLSKEKSKENSPSENEKVSIMTFHSSKGLEFDTVIIPDAIDGKIPNKGSFENNIEEERRLFYVAMTRAQKKLYITYSSGANGKRLFPSIFITNLIKI